jgi:formylglycine-generating enzyme required for sulfatase activity
MKNLFLSALVTVVSILPLQADTFGTGGNQFTLDFTSIGNAGNAADPLTGYGSVGYNYRIGTYTISQNQIDAARANGLQGVTGGAWSGDKPAANISWYQAAAFVNWLDTSTGHQAAYNLTYSNGSYTMDLWHSWDAGYDPNNLYRNKNALYVLPSENEFYKAAYGKNSGSGYYIYPTASDIVPTAVASGTTADTAVYNQSLGQGPASVYEAGGLSSYGTMGQGGNIWAWQESSFGGGNSATAENRVLRGGKWFLSADPLLSSFRDIAYPSGEGFDIGFRVASVIPEPSTYALFGIGAVGMLMVMRRKTAA